MLSLSIHLQLNQKSLLSASPRGAVWHVSAGSEGISLLLCRLQLLGQLWAVLDWISLLHHLNGGVVCEIYVLKVWGSSSQKPIWPSPITQPWPAALPYCVAAPSRFSSFSLTVFFGRVIGKGEHGLKHSTIPSVVCDSWVKMKAAANIQKYNFVATGRRVKLIRYNITEVTFENVFLAKYPIFFFFQTCLTYHTVLTERVASSAN